MEIFLDLLQLTYAIFNIDLTLFGFTFSFWDIFLWTLFGSIVLAFIVYLLS